jgi:predicted  nucleic acid-binding Zn-ribbon protein
MTRSEYQELVEFLAPKFGRIDERFDEVDRRFEAIDRRFEAIDRRFEAIDRRFEAIENRLTRVEVLGEEDRDRSRILAEAISSLNGKVDAFRDTIAEEFLAVRTEMRTGFRAVRDEMAEGFERLGGRVTRLENLQA